MGSIIRTADNTNRPTGMRAVKLDDHAAPDDNTDNNATTAAHGLCPKGSGVSTEFLNGNLGWSTPAGGSGSSSPQSYAHVYNDANISINDSTDTALTFNQERSDTDAYHSTSANTGRLTIPTGGDGGYLFGCPGIAWATGAAGLGRVSIRLNGTTIIASTGDLSLGDLRQPCVGQYDFVAGDYIEVVVRQESGAALNVLNAANYSPEFWIAKIGGSAVQSPVFNGRLTLTTALPVTISDVTAATTVYWALYGGNYITCINGTSNITLATAELSIKLTDAQTGTTTSGNAVITGLTSTAQLVRGMKASGTGIGVAAVISSIDSATQVTLSVNSTASASVTVTFKCPASTNYDIVLVYNSGSPRLQFLAAWTDATTRADALGTQNGLLVNNADAPSSGSDSNEIAAKTGVYLGSVRTTTTDGQTEVSTSHLGVWNYYHRTLWALSCKDTTDSWTYTTVAYREINGGSTLGTSRVGAIVGVTEHAIVGRANHQTSTASGEKISGCGIGVDSSTVNSGHNYGGTSGSGSTRFNWCDYVGKPSAGYRTFRFLESPNTTSSTTTWYGDLSASTALWQSGMTIQVWG